MLHSNPENVSAGATFVMSHSCHKRFLSIREYRQLELEKILKEALITWSPAMIIFDSKYLIVKFFVKFFVKFVNI